MFKMYDIIVAKENLKNVPKGSLGTILEVYENNDYEIEFVNALGHTLNILTINEKYIDKYLT